MKKNKKGFTLAELLIVVAIIGVLVAISIPIFNNQLKKARFATNVANARAAKAAVFATYYDTNEPMKCKVYDIKTGTVSNPKYGDARDYTAVHANGSLYWQIRTEPETWTMKNAEALTERVYSKIGVERDSSKKITYLERHVIYSINSNSLRYMRNLSLIIRSWAGSDKKVMRDEGKTE